MSFALTVAIQPRRSGRFPGKNRRKAKERAAPGGSGPFLCTPCVPPLKISRYLKRSTCVAGASGAPHRGAALLRRTSVLPKAKPRRRTNSFRPSILKSPGIQKKHWSKTSASGAPHRGAALLRRTSVLAEGQNLGGGGIHFRRAF